MTPEGIRRRLQALLPEGYKAAVARATIGRGERVLVLDPAGEEIASTPLKAVNRQILKGRAWAKVLVEAAKPPEPKPEPEPAPKQKRRSRKKKVQSEGEE